MRKQIATACVAALAVTGMTNAAVVGEVDFDGTSTGLISFTQSPAAGAFSSPGDGFEEYNSGDDAPFQLIDSSIGTFPDDTRGIVVEDPTGAYDGFFGITDTNNGDNQSGEFEASWTFDISSVVSDLAVSIDMAAWGDFEDGDDLFDWYYSIDGSAEQLLFASSVDEDAVQSYTMADGEMFTDDDPLSVGGVTLNNSFQAVIGQIGATGDELTLTIRGMTNGGSEAYAFDNVVVEGVIPEPASLALLGMGGLMMLRRRK